MCMCMHYTNTHISHIGMCVYMFIYYYTHITIA